jgi:putative ABC transport system permease protein
MMRSLLASTVRSFLRYRVYSAVTISGLALGMAISLLIFLMVSDELGYDRFHRRSGSIYRIAGEYRPSGAPIRVALTPGPLGPTLSRELHGGITAARFWKNPESSRSTVISPQGVFHGEQVMFTEPAAFEVFTFPLVKSGGAPPLSEPYTAVLTESAAKRYFGPSDPLGKIIHVSAGEPFELRIAGVMRDLPGNSHMRFDVLASLATIEKSRASLFEDWRRADFYTYLLLPDGVSPETIAAKFPAVIGGFFDPEERGRMRFFLQPLFSIHLRSHLEGELEQNGDIRDVYGLIAAALFILLIACANYTNIVTARSSFRVREAALRKTFGATRFRLAARFIGESIVASFIALAFALALAEIVLPGFNALTGRALALEYRNPLFYGGVLAAAALIGIAAGIYPAWRLSGFNPATALRGIRGTQSGSSVPRRALVALQFAISAFLIICAGIVGSQLAFLGAVPLGFDSERLLVVPLETPDLRRNIESIRERVSALPGVLGAAASSDVPGEQALSRYEFMPDGEEGGSPVAMFGMMTDDRFLATYGIPLVSGRNFTGFGESAKADEIIINETAVRAFGWTNPLGKQLSWGIVRGTVIGVARDFHFQPLRERIGPLFLYHSPNRLRYLSIRLDSDRADAVSGIIDRIGGGPGPGSPPDRYFILDRFDPHALAEERTRRVLGACAFLAMAITCVGLYGLAAFTTAQKYREIGIRKAFGASVADILILLTKDFAGLFLAAQAVAWPAAFLVMRAWLSASDSRVAISPRIFFAGAAAVFVIAFAAVGFHTVRAALANPAAALRYE